MMWHTRTVRTVLAFAALAVVIMAARTSGQSAAPPLDPTLAELRAMRADLNERLEANIRVQLLVARLTLQEQRTSDVIRQLAEVSEKMRTHEQSKAQFEATSKMFGLEAAKPGEEENFLSAMLRAGAESSAKAEVELTQRHAELTTALAQEQARWQAFNSQLAELERLFEKPRK